MSQSERRFKIGIDVGGTFTDFFVRAGGGEPVIHKVLSTPDDPSVGVIDGLRELAADDFAAFMGAIEMIVHGTTVTTNATLTRRGARIGLLTTDGRARRPGDAARHPRGAATTTATPT